MSKESHKKKSAARLLGVQILFEMEINGKNTKTVIKRLTESYLKEISELNNDEVSDKGYLIKILKRPYSNHENILEFQQPNKLKGDKYQTFCGT